MRRRQARDTAAFLVDQDRRVAAADAVAQSDDQIAQLLRLLAVPGEEAEAERVGGGEEISLGPGQRRAGAAEDDRARHRGTVRPVIEQPSTPDAAPSTRGTRGRRQRLGKTTPPRSCTRCLCRRDRRGPRRRSSGRGYPDWPSSVAAT